MVDTNDDLNNDENHDQQQQEVEQQQPAADAIIADCDSDSEDNSDSDSDSNSHDDDDEDNGDDDDDDEDNEDNEEGNSDDESAASVVAADTMLVRANRRAKLLSLLDQYNACPFRTRNNIDDLVAEALEKAEDDVHEMLCDQNADNYQGLDINRDTVKQVETIVRIFPNLLSKRKETKWDHEEGEWIAAEDGEGKYPIQCVLDLYGPNGFSLNLKATPFVATLAQLGNDLNPFGEEDRGGLLIENADGYNTLQCLALMAHSGDDEELDQRTETICLSQLIQLRRMGLFKQENIPQYNLVHEVCYKDHFVENTFQFLVEWDPSSLVHIDEDGKLPLHCAAQKLSIEGFRTVVEYLIRYYPTKKGISSLFSKTNQGETPFQIACEKHGKDGVMRIIDDTLNNSVIPLNTVEALVTAAANVHVHFECVYLLLRRKPDVLVRLLSEPHNNNNDDDDDGGGGEYGEYGEDEDEDEDDHDHDHDNDGDNIDDKNDIDEDDDNDGDNVNNENHDDVDDEESDEDVGIEDSKNNGTGTRKRKRRGCSDPSMMEDDK